MPRQNLVIRNSLISAAITMICVCFSSFDKPASNSLASVFLVSFLYCFFVHFQTIKVSDRPHIQVPIVTFTWGAIAILSIRAESVAIMTISLLFLLAIDFMNTDPRADRIDIRKIQLRW
jgi:hypothetical protein